MRAALDAVQDARMRMFEAMRAEPFDAAALDAAFADVRAKTNELQRVGQEIVARRRSPTPRPTCARRIRPPRGPFP